MFAASRRRMAWSLRLGLARGAVKPLPTCLSVVEKTVQYANLHGLRFP